MRRINDGSVSDAGTKRCPSGVVAARKPNIIFIMADDLGYGDLSCYNNESKIQTPNLDRLAAEGIRFTDAHAPSAVCLPCRYALLTGQYAWRTERWRARAQVKGSDHWGKEPYLPADRLTVPKLLKQQGYATACIGKWQLGWNWPTKDDKPAVTGFEIDFSRPITQGPTTRGFDYYFGTDVPNFPPFCFIENDRTIGIPSVPSPPEFDRPGPMLPGWRQVEILPELTRRAVHYIEDRSKAREPFFLYLPLTSPHTPVVPTPEFQGKTKIGIYADFVVQTDWTVGQILETLQRIGLAPNTLVIFTSDNGPEVTKGASTDGVYERLRTYGHSSAGPLRGAKRTAWEGGHRVPFIARWPARAMSGVVSDETICHVDLLATLAGILDVNLPQNAGEDSFNILPALIEQKLDKPIRHATVLHGVANGDPLVIRQGDWALIDFPTGDCNEQEPEWFKKERGYQPHNYPGELYDLKHDLAQSRNLYAEYPEKVRELKALLEKLKREGRSAPDRR
jgi:arylsulfatase A